MINPASSLHACVGKPASQLIPILLQFNPQIEAVHLVAYRPAPNLGERMAGGGGVDPRVVERASALHEELGIGFWDSVLGMALRRGELGDEFARLAMVHEAAPDETEYRLSRGDIGAGEMEALAGSLPESYALALSSRVALKDNGEAHLPMLDFRCPHSDAAVGLMKELLRGLSEKQGALVQSPRSYHYYGFDLLPAQGLTPFLARALLGAPVVDARYVAHRLLDGACRLRLTSGGGKGQAPVVEEIFDASAAR